MLLKRRGKKEHEFWNHNSTTMIVLWQTGQLNGFSLVKELVTTGDTFLREGNG